MTPMPDVQSTPDVRNMPINQVGIKALRFPIRFKTHHSEQYTIAHFAMTVSLPAEQKGTHMSRFVAILEENQNAFDLNTLHQLTEKMLHKLHAHSGKISMAFPFFRKKNAPVTGIASLLDYDVTLSAEIKNGAFSGCLKILVPITSLCPCSKEISQYGAHNQRSHVTLTLHSHNDQISIEEIIDLIEQQGSSQLYGLLKRPDEKFVTEKAYENPKFVEDIVRDVAVALRNDSRIQAFEVESENFESIHNHSAYAYIAYP